MASLEVTATNSEALQAPRIQRMSVVLALLVISIFINYVDRGNLSIAAPLLKDELGLSAAKLGILLSAFFWSYTAVLFICGWFVDHLDVNWVLATGLLMWSLATAGTGLVHGFAGILIMRIALGMGESVAFPCYSKILAQRLPEHYRGLANGAIMAGMKLGPAAGTLAGGMLMTQYGWRPVFIGIGLISLLWLPGWIKWHPQRLPIVHSFSPSVAAILRQREFWADASSSFCGVYPLYFMLTWLPFYLVHEQHLSLPQMVKVAALYYTMDGLASLTTGWLTDLFISTGLRVGLVRKSAMALGWTTAAAGFLGCAWAGPHYLSWLLVTGLGIGMGGSGVWAFTQTLAGPQAVGRWAGFKNGFSNFAGIICPALTGFTLDWTGHFHLAIAITSGICLAGAIGWVMLVGELKEVSWTQNIQQRSAAAAETF
jgi:ACS family D-galactonate transporter-like MFS transporter